MKVVEIDEGARENALDLPAPFRIEVEGNVNGVDLSIHGAGAISVLGVYEATLNLSTIPPSFHPSAVATFLVSICCNYGGAMRNGALNIRAMGADGYSTKRTLTFGDDGEEIVIEGDVDGSGSELTFHGTINGSAELPDGLAGNSIYVKRLEPLDDGATVRGIGEGSLFMLDGNNVPVKIESFHQLRPTPVPNPLRRPQIRMVTESGVLTGRTYRTNVHAAVDSTDAVPRILGMA